MMKLKYWNDQMDIHKLIDIQKDKIVQRLPLLDNIISGASIEWCMSGCGGCSVEYPCVEVTGTMLHIPVTATLSTYNSMPCLCEVWDIRELPDPLFRLYNSDIVDQWLHITLEHDKVVVA